MIDLKFVFEGHNPCTGKDVSQENSFIIKASDPVAPEICSLMITAYSKLGCETGQLIGVKLLRDRVIEYQKIHGIHKPDVNECEAGRTNTIQDKERT